MESRSLYHPADVALSRGAIPNHRVECALTSPTPSNRMFSALLARFGLTLTQLAPQQIQQPVQFQTLQASHQLPPPSSPSTLALSECEPRQNPCSIHQISQESGVDGVRFTLPATGQRTGANPNPSPLATTTSTPTLPSRKPEWDHDDRDLLL